MSALPATKNQAAAKWIEQGIKQHELFRRAFQTAKEHAFNAGIFFWSAQQSAQEGDWQLLLGAFEAQISERTVYRYIAFATEVMEWVKAEHPQIKDLEKLRAAGSAMVLKSPKGYIALCRQLELMRKFGEYDEVKYKTKKLLGAGQPQLEFSFAELTATIDVLTHFGDDNYSFKYAEGADEAATLDEVERKLETALARVRMIKQHGKVVEV
jgi:hypothetical protein